jgi:hypothetical protein
MEVTWWIEGARNKWELGSSTSQSINWTAPWGSERAKLTAMVVFPVPPFPLAIEIISINPAYLSTQLPPVLALIEPTSRGTFFHLFQHSVRHPKEGLSHHLLAFSSPPLIKV